MIPLRLGDQGEAVRDLQQLLNAAGASIAVDGVFGGQTDAAVRAFQADAGITVDGIAGEQTFSALASVQAGVSVSTAAAAAGDAAAGGKLKGWHIAAAALAAWLLLGG